MQSETVPSESNGCFSEKYVRCKVSLWFPVGKHFIGQLRRRVEVNQLSQASKILLANRQLVTQVLDDWRALRMSAGRGLLILQKERSFCHQDAVSSGASVFEDLGPSGRVRRGFSFFKSFPIHWFSNSSVSCPVVLSEMESCLETSSSLETLLLWMDSIVEKFTSGVTIFGRNDVAVQFFSEIQKTWFIESFAAFALTRSNYELHQGSRNQGKRAKTFAGNRPPMSSQMVRDVTCSFVRAWTECSQRIFREVQGAPHFRKFSAMLITWLWKRVTDGLWNWLFTAQCQFHNH